MRRYAILKKFIRALEDNDVAIFSGHEMCKEAYQFDRPGNFYISKPYSVTASFALGAAMCTDKRVFVFVGEGDLLRELAMAAQLSASGCANIFLVVLDNGAYQECAKLPNIMGSIKSKRGVMYNMGLAVFDFTVYAERKEFNKMEDFLKNLRGPIVLFFDVDLGLKKDLAEVDIPEQEMKDKLTEFLNNKETGTSLYEVTGPALNVKDVKPEVLTDGI